MGWRDKIDMKRLPQHIAIIMDGNGRWAKKQGQIRTFGHQVGVKAVKDVVEGAAELGISFLTLYTFSTENWNRPASEVTALMELLVDTMHEETPTLIKNNVKLAAIGDISSLPEKCQNKLADTIQVTAAHTGLTLVLALSYSSRWEILSAVNQIIEKVKKGETLPVEINEHYFKNFLCTAIMPDPELLIRTSGEKRISNFLLWQIAYTELFFSEVLWPDFTRNDLFQAIVDYQQRERRFGVISEQLA
ncbi:MAG: isoprenyl transferase [Candidatus Competibacteraceae bacterium]|nr:isoprenyl transferase [Candidatus Competibacteraceae bacterium]